MHKCTNTNFACLIILRRICFGNYSNTNVQYTFCRQIFYIPCSSRTIRRQRYINHISKKYIWTNVQIQVWHVPNAPHKEKSQYTNRLEMEIQIWVKLRTSKIPEHCLIMILSEYSIKLLKSHLPIYD